MHFGGCAQPPSSPLARPMSLLLALRSPCPRGEGMGREIGISRTGHEDIAREVNERSKGWPVFLPTDCCGGAFSACLSHAAKDSPEREKNWKKAAMFSPETCRHGRVSLVEENFTHHGNGRSLILTTMIGRSSYFVDVSAIIEHFPSAAKSSDSVFDKSTLNLTWWGQKIKCTPERRMFLFSISRSSWL